MREGDPGSGSRCACPGRDVSAVLAHTDGTSDALPLRHTMISSNAGFKAGSR